MKGPYQTHRSYAADDDLSGTARNLEQKSREIVNARGVRDDCAFEVHREGKWYVFDGSVDSQSTKNELFGLVPKVDGALWIVDRLSTQGRRGRRKRGGSK